MKRLRCANGHKQFTREERLLVVQITKYFRRLSILKKADLLNGVVSASLKNKYNSCPNHWTSPLRQQRRSDGDEISNKEENQKLFTGTKIIVNVTVRKSSCEQLMKSLASDGSVFTLGLIHLRSQAFLFPVRIFHDLPFVITYKYSSVGHLFQDYLVRIQN